MTVPRASLGLAERDVLAGMRHPVSTDAGSGRLLSSFLSGLTNLDAGPDARAAQHVGDAGVALLAGAIIASPLAGVEVGPGLVRAQIVSYIEGNLADPQLNTDSIAAATTWLRGHCSACSRASSARCRH